nr:tRNA pseudouridine(38-40) synthase TruA [Conchiformibius kuhniae]
MTRYALTLAYDGSRFAGWQKQAGDTPTVQSALEHALSQMAGETVRTFAAGRTDTGVHAAAQTVHFDTAAVRPLQAWVRGVNALLPNSIAVLHAQAVPPHFHARFDACARRYRYILQSAPVRAPHLYQRAGWTHYPLNENKMAQAAARLIGTHDFSAFRAAQCQAKSPVKTLYQLDIARTGDLIKLDFHANAFLHHMVRNIVGTLVYVGCGRLPPEHIDKLLATRNRCHAPPTFMPDGLYFLGADYPDTFGIARPTLPAWL